MKLPQQKQSHKGKCWGTSFTIVHDGGIFLEACFNSMWGERASSVAMPAAAQ